MKEIVEEYKEIASRIAPGDRWTVIGVNDIQNSLTEALEAYYMVADVKPKSFILDLEKGKIFIIFTSEHEVILPEAIEERDNNDEIVDDIDEIDEILGRDDSDSNGVSVL